MSISTEARKEALSEFIGSPLEIIDDVNFENVFFDGAHRFDEGNEKPIGFYLVLHKTEKDYVKSVGLKNAIGKQDGFLIFLSDKKGNIDLEATEIVRQIEAEDRKKFKTFEVLFYNETAGWRKQTRRFKVAHEQDADAALHKWADKEGFEIDVIEINVID